MNRGIKTTSLSYFKWRLLFYMLMSIGLSVISVLPYSTTRAGSKPTVVTSIESSLPAPMQQPTLESNGTSLIPFLHIVPDSDGETVTISLDRDTPLPGMLYANVGIGPTGYKSGWTMPYSDTQKSYISTIPFVLSETPIAGSVNLTSNQGLNTMDVQFSGVEVPARSLTPLRSEDHQVELEPASAATIPFDTYMVVVTNMGKPGADPVDHQMIGHSYSLRAASNLIQTPQPLNLIWHVNTPAFTNVDLHTLDIFYWGEDGGWIPLHAELSRRANWLQAQTKLFGTYAVFAKPLWQAQLANNDSLDLAQNHNVATDLDEPYLRLIDTPGQGSATSRLIAPQYGLQSWGVISFTTTMSAPATLLTVDVLDQTGRTLLTNVQSGQSLTALNVQDYPALQLRAYLTSTIVDVTPVLYSWQVSWQPLQPVAIGVGGGGVDLGQTITVPLTMAIPAGSTVGGVTLDVQYDPAILQVVDCRLLLTGDLPGLCNMAYDADQMNPDGLRLSLITSATITTTPIAELSFRAVNWSATPTMLGVANVLAVSPAGMPLPVVTATSQLTITSAASGDVNCDDSVDAVDIDLILGYIVNLRQASTTCPPPDNTLFLSQCDINHDSACDVRDVQILVR